MKKVLYVVPGLNPSYKDGASNRCASFINCFADHGYKVTCVALTNYREFPKAWKYRKTYLSKAKWRIIPHLYFLDNYYKNFYVLFEKLYIYLLNLFNRYDYILADYATGADIVSWVRGKSKIIVNYRGDQIDEHIMAHNCSEKCPSVKTLKKLIRDSVFIADYSICVSSALKNNIEEYADTKLLNNYIFPCCANIKRFSQYTNNCSSVFQDKIVLGYFGGLSKWQCVENVIDFAIELNKIDSRYYLLLLTNSPIGALQEKLEQLGEDNYSVKSLGFTEIPSWISTMNISFNLRESRPLNIVASPTKLSESLAAGVPVIVTEHTGDYRDIITDGINGVVLSDITVSENNVQKIHSFIQQTLINSDHTRKVCINAVAERTWENFSDGLINFIEFKQQ